MKVVLDTNVVVAGVRSPAGASAELLRRIIVGRVKILASAPIFIEYEAVLSRPEQLAGANATPDDVRNLLNVLAKRVEPVDIRYLWRPFLTDPTDDMILEAAFNGGADAIVTFNLRHFRNVAVQFDIDVLTPAATLHRNDP